MSRSWGRIGKALSAALVIAVAVGAIGLVLQQLAGQRGQRNVTNDTVAAAWNDSIAKLGILPVYPPEEDLHVGDLWAVITDAEKTPLLGKAVRITYIDLRPDMQAEQLRQPRFSRTVEPENGKRLVAQASVEDTTLPPADQIKLSLAVFPGISINSAREVSGGLARWLPFGGAATDEEVEQVRIPVAETYGLSAAAAAGRLKAWCRAPDTALFCREDFIRNALAFAVSDSVLATRDGQYIVKLQLRLVHRVFMTREIVHRRFRTMAAVAGAGAAQPGGVEGDAAAVPEAAPSQPRKLSVPGTLGASYGRQNSHEFAVQQLLERPVVFGIRAVSAKPVPTPGESTQTSGSKQK